MDWRKIEQALIEIAISHDCVVTQVHGESLIDIDFKELSLERLAKELAERLK